MSYIKNLPYFIAIISNFLLAVFVLSKGKKEKVNQAFFNSVISANLWLISLFLYYTTESDKYVLWLGRINFAMVLPILYYFLKFVMIFPREITFDSKKIKVFLSLWFFFLIAVTIFTPLIAQEEIIVGPGQRETIYGQFYPVYILTYFLSTLGIIFLLLYKATKFKIEREKLQIRYVLLGITISLLFGFISNIIFPLFGFFDIANYGPLATIIFSIFVTIAIVRHHLFEIKVVLVQFLVIVIALILFIQAWLEESFGMRFLNSAVFILFCLFGYYLIKSTLNEIKRREEMEKISKDLKEAYADLTVLDKAKSEFVSIASHQLRTPLTVIKGYLSLIQEKIYGKPPEKMERPLRNIYISTERLIRLVNDLLSISRIESGKIKPELEKLSLEDIINSVVNELEPLAKKKNLYLKWEQPKEPMPQVLADKDKIRQVILNLIDNGIRYTEKGGVVVEYKKEKKKCRMIVSDTGPGMEEKEISNLFRSFRRGSVGQKTWTGGTGLGLYIAKKFMDMHKGKIWAESKGEGKGSTFYIELSI